MTLHLDSVQGTVNEYGYNTFQHLKDRLIVRLNYKRNKKLKTS
jgi:hypothetical protein